jgi:hypothetical protein
MNIKIIKANKYPNWYNDKIGAIFEAEEYGRYYKVIFGEAHFGLVHIEDLEIVN